MENIKLIEIEGSRYAVELSDSAQQVVFKTQAEANQFKLSLLLGTQPTPNKAPNLYQLISDSEGLKIYSLEKAQSNRDQDDWGEEGCCQSGCSGCPWTISQENNL